MSDGSDVHDVVFLARGSLRRRAGGVAERDRADAKKAAEKAAAKAEKKAAAAARKEAGLPPLED